MADRQRSSWSCVGASMSTMGTWKTISPASLIQSRRGGSSLRDRRTWMPCARSQARSSADDGRDRAANRGRLIQVNPCGEAMVRARRTRENVLISIRNCFRVRRAGPLALGWRADSGMDAEEDDELAAELGEVIAAAA